MKKPVIGIVITDGIVDYVMFDGELAPDDILIMYKDSKDDDETEQRMEDEFSDACGKDMDQNFWWITVAP